MPEMTQRNGTTKCLVATGAGRGGGGGQDEGRSPLAGLVIR